jgi:hypothetical protein
MHRLYEVADAAGRARSTISVTLFGAQPQAPYLQRCREAGIDRALLTLPSEGYDATLKRLDGFQSLLS